MILNVLMMIILGYPQCTAFHTIEQYHELYNLLPELVWVTDAIGNVIFLNDCYTRFVGITDFSQHDWVECLHPDDIKDMTMERAIAIERKSMFHTHYRLRDGFGVYKWFLSRATPLINEQGEVIKWFGVNTEIQDKVEALEKEKNHNIFFAANTHDLKTPITGIIGLTQLLIQTDLSDSQRSDLKSILQCGLSVLSLITNILDFCRIETKKIDLDIVPFSMEDVVEHVVKLAKMTKNQNIILEMNEHLRNPHLIRGDASRVSQVVTNVVTNAVKFTKSHGTIIITVTLVNGIQNKESSHYDVSRTSEIGIDPDIIYVECKIEDNGSGIDKQTMRHLFDPFTQSTDQNRPLVTKGHGLGLYICKNLMTLMNGHISVQSQMNVGTTFKIIFPYYPDTRRYSQDSLYSELAMVPRSRGVMIVEDNPINRDVVKRILTLEDYTVYAYENGKDSILGFRQNYELIDLVLMDLHLPDMGGNDIAVLFRQHEVMLHIDESRRVPILAFTASTLPGELSEALESGMNGFLTKPFIRKDLLSKIMQNIRK